VAVPHRLKKGEEKERKGRGGEGKTGHAPDWNLPTLNSEARFREKTKRGGGKKKGMKERWGRGVASHNHVHVLSMRPTGHERRKKEGKKRKVRCRAKKKSSW